MLPSEEDVTKTYFSVRAKKNVDLDSGKLVEVKNGETFNVRPIQIRVVSESVDLPNQDKDLKIMQYNTSNLEVYFSPPNTMPAPWNLSFSAVIPNTLSTFWLQVNPVTRSRIEMLWNVDGLTFVIYDIHGQIEYTSSASGLLQQDFHHVSIEYVDSKLCFWVNGVQKIAYRSLNLKLLSIELSVPKLGILSFYNRNLNKQEIVQHFIDYHVKKLYKRRSINLDKIKMKKPTAPNLNLYPELPQATEQVDQGVQFRLNKISEIRDFLENEVDQRDKLRRKYKTVWNVFYNTAQVSGLVALGSGGGAVGTMATGIGAVVSIPLGVVAIAGSVISGGCVALGKAMMKKVEKHESVKRTAESSLNTVNDLVSRALEDGIVSNEDFHHILREMENYRGHKVGIKHRTRANLIELTTERESQIRAEAEQAGLEKGKIEALQSLLSTVTSSGEKN